ncbi:MAG: nucleotidyltransferase family protein [Lachnospiraceae bacterium]|nr:nucleotidyltransferase family protein [Lachnospiraceae bacterium]
MKTVGIIAEYNPFHTGHAWQISEARRITGADCVIVIMSGDFVQRGTPAIMNKYMRTELALTGGADIVIELPVWISTASAMDFAEGAVSVFNALGCIDYLCFGSESGSTDKLKQAADLFLLEPDNYKTELKKQLSCGKSFPKARKAAWGFCTGENGDFLDLPNNILGISYLMALKKTKSHMKPVTVKRQGDFHSLSTDNQFASASALRNSMMESSNSSELQNRLSRFMPDSSAFTTFIHGYQKEYPVISDDFWPVLKAKLLSESVWNETYYDLPDELAARIRKQFFSCNTYEELVTALKTALYTRTRIERSLIHLLLDLKEEEVLQWKEHGWAHYARILGFRKSAASYLKTIVSSSSIPVFSRSLPDQGLNPAALSCYRKDIFAANLYESTACMKYRLHPPIHEYSRGIIVSPS